MNTDGLKEKLIRNEQLLRDKNRDAGKAIEKYFSSHEEIEHAPIAFMCECSKLDCNEHVHQSIEQYNKIHEKKNHFMVHPGHEIPLIENVIHATDDYLIVEKPTLAQ